MMKAAAGFAAVVTLAAIWGGGRGISLLITEVLIMALFASSLNLLISFGRVVSFGHAAYFGLGAYGFALAVVRAKLPVGAALLFGPLLAALGALAFGALCVRLSKIYFAMLTLACGQIAYTILFQWYDFTGGDTGLTGFAAPRLGLSEPAFATVTLALVVACLLLLWRVVRSPLGLAIRSVGQDDRRAEASGLDPRNVQLIAFVIAGFLAGIAGTLFSAAQANAFPDYSGMGMTLDSLIMVTLGGIGNFFAGIAGAVAFVAMRTYIPRIIPEWELVVGMILLVIVLTTPSGLMGGVARVYAKLAGRNPA